MRVHPCSRAAENRVRAFNPTTNFPISRALGCALASKTAPAPAIVRTNLANSLVELSESQHANEGFLSKPILITANGTIISGFRDWQVALIDLATTIDCFEYPLSDEEALQFILMHHRPRRFWNSFSRIQLALELEPYFQAKASANRSHGGKYKGSANLPRAEHIDMRQEVARLTDVGGICGRSRTMGSVNTKEIFSGHEQSFAVIQRLRTHRYQRFRAVTYGNV